MHCAAASARLHAAPWAADSVRDVWKIVQGYADRRAAHVDAGWLASFGILPLAHMVLQAGGSVWDSRSGVSGSSNL
jgi:hypothetical protein